MQHLALLGLIGALALAMDTQAQTPATDAPAPTAADVAAAPAGAAATPADAEQAPRHNCLRSTGTRIRSRDKDGCLHVYSPSRVYSRADIERTGETEISEALQRLDPSISTR